jgi:fimbrial chaperone protein
MEAARRLAVLLSRPAQCLAGSRCHGRAPWRLLAVLLLSCTPLATRAYVIAPALVTLRSAGAESNTFFRLQNPEPKAVAVEITIQEHDKDIDGNAIAGPAADDLFVVFPSQIVLVPGDEAAVQVRWIGDAAPPRERVFALVAREVAIPPASPEPESTSDVRVDLTVLVNYEARLYVAPPGARPQVIVASATEVAPGPADAQQPMLEVILANEGTAHRDLAGLALQIAPVDAAGAPLPRQAVTVPVRDLPGARPHLLAGEQRRLRIPRPSVLPAGRLDVQLAR